MSYSRLLITAALLWTAPVLAEDGGISPRHDDHGQHEPVKKGVSGAFCVSGVSNGFPCKNVELMSRLPLGEIGGGSGNDSWGWKDQQTGRYYAIMARSNGTSFVDISDPENPVFVGDLPSTLDSKPWRDVKVYKDHAFIVADAIEGHGMQVFDLTRLRSASPPALFDPDALYEGVDSAHNLAINEDSGFAVLVGGEECSGGLHFVDIRTPLSPVFAGCFDGDGYTHDVQCVTYQGPDAEHAGSEVCFASNEDSLTIVDITDKGAPVMLGKTDYPDTAYSHQGWLDETQSLFFMGDEIDELSMGMNTRTLILDVADLDQPAFLDAHAHSTTAIDHNMYVKGDFLFQANYKAGLRILKIDRSGGVALREVAYFDTEPENDALEFAGAWNVYPFFDNNIVIVSDMRNGLFVLRADTAALGDRPIDGSTSGAWVAEGLNDQGMMILVGETGAGPFIFYAWFLFLEGEPFWLTGSAAFEYGDDSVSIPTQRLSGLEFVTESEANATREDIGDLLIHAHDCEALHVAYDFAGLGSRELTFTRLGSVQGRGCTN